MKRPSTFVGKSREVCAHTMKRPSTFVGKSREVCAHTMKRPSTFVWKSREACAHTMNGEVAGANVPKIAILHRHLWDPHGSRVSWRCAYAHGTGKSRDKSGVWQNVKCKRALCGAIATLGQLFFVRNERP